MASAHCLASTGCVGVAPAHGRDKVLVTVEGDGVTQYDLNTKSPIRSWALGKGNIEFAAPAVYHRASQRLFAAVHGGAGPTLLSWAPSADAGTIQQVATHVTLPGPVAAVLPLPGRRPTDAMDLDVASAAPAVFVAHSNGAVSLCSPTEVLSESAEGLGSPLLSASVEGEALLSVHAARGAAAPGALLARFSAAGGTLRCEAMRHVAPPSDGAAPVAAGHSAGRALLLWSDGSVAAYDVSALSTAAKGTSVDPLFVRRLKGFALEPVDAAVPETKGKKTPARRKRGLNGGEGGGGAAAAVVAPAGEGVMLVAGWASAQPSALRVVAIDAAYGAVQAATTLTANDVGAPKLDNAKLLQACGLLTGTNQGQVLLAAGGAALVADLDVRPPTLANLIGSLRVASQAQRDADIPTAALAAAAALQEDDLAALAAPAGGAAGPLRFGLTAAAAPANELLSATEVQWEVSGSAALREAEATAWSQLLDVAASGGGKKGPSEAAFLAIVQPLLQKTQKSRSALSYDLLCKLLMAATEYGHWGAVEALLGAQHPGSLAGCPGLASALAGSSRYDLLHVLLSGATDVAAADILAVLRSLLGSAPAASGKGKAAAAAAAAQRAQQAYAARIRAAADEAVSAAETAKASNAPNAAALVAAARCAAGAAEGFSPRQLCLHPLLSARHDSAVLLTALRDLPGPHAVALLRYLLRWLRNHRHLIGEAHPMSVELPSLAIPGPADVVAWVAAALDAGMSRLMLRADAAAVAAELRAEVAPAAAAARGLARVKGAVEHLQCGAPLPEAPSGGAAGRYTLEWLSLKVA